MKVCPSCSGRYEDDKNFCRLDGARLVPERAFAPEVVAKRQLLEKRLEEEPENPSLLLELGDLLASVPTYDEALVQFFKALELDPASEAVRRRIALVYRAKGEWTEAQKHLEDLIGRRPTDTDLLGELAEAYYRSGQTAEAARVLARTCELAPSEAPVWNRRRALLEELHGDAELVPVYRRLSELTPDDVSVWLAFAETMAAAPSGRPEDWIRVERALSQALDTPSGLSPAEADRARVGLVLARVRLGKATPGQSALLGAVHPAGLDRRTNGIAADCLVEIAALAERERREADALEAYELALKFQDRPRARQALGSIYAGRAGASIRAGAYREAVRYAEEGLSYCPEDAELSRRKSSALRRRKVRRLGYAALALLGLGLTALAVLYQQQRGPFGESPTPADLIRSFGRLLKSQEAVGSFSSNAGGRELSLEIAGERWQVRIGRASVQPVDDGTRSYQGTLETRWEKNGVPVTSLRGMPPQLTKLGLGPGTNAARFMSYGKKWRW
jgi:tetratricopeptide (TPR) repeat protein